MNAPRSTTAIPRIRRSRKPDPTFQNAAGKSPASETKTRAPASPHKCAPRAHRIAQKEKPQCAPTDSIDAPTTDRNSDCPRLAPVDEPLPEAPRHSDRETLKKEAE